MFYVVKVLISALIIVAVSEVSKRTPTWGGVIGSLPLVSILAMTWVYIDTGDRGKVAALATSTLWFVLPSLLLFLILPMLLRAGKPFWLSMGIAVVATAGGYLIMATMLKKFGVKF
jgi:hypothetical protein